MHKPVYVHTAMRMNGRKCQVKIQKWREDPMKITHRSGRIKELAGDDPRKKGIAHWWERGDVGPKVCGAIPLLSRSYRHLCSEKWKVRKPLQLITALSQNKTEPTLRQGNLGLFSVRNEHSGPHHMLQRHYPVPKSYPE